MNKQQVIFGWHPIFEALESGQELQKVYLLRGLRGDRADQCIAMCKSQGIPVQHVPQQKLDRLTRKNHQGVIAHVSPVEFHELGNLLSTLFEKGLVPALLAMDGVTDVRNFGAICRSAEALGFHGVVIPATGMALINDDAIKSSSGALMRLPVVRSQNFAGSLREMQLSGLTLAGLSEKAAQPLDSANFSEPVCIVMGNEEKGLSDASIRLCDLLLKIPLSGATASLNVAAAAAIALYAVSSDRNY